MNPSLVKALVASLAVRCGSPVALAICRLVVVMGFPSFALRNSYIM
jgi:hypothetical protein